MDEQGRLRVAAERMEKHIAKVLWGVAALAALYILWSFVGCQGCAGSLGMWVSVTALAFLVAGHFVNAFTRDLPSSKDDGKLGRELRWIFVYGYVLQGFALGMGLLLLIGLVPSVPQGKLGGQMGGLVQGCQESETGYGSDLIRCADGDPVQQWLLHIGSSAEGPFESDVEKDMLNAMDYACDSDVEEVGISEALRMIDGSVGSVERGVVSAVAGACEGVEADRHARIKESLLAKGVVSRQYSLEGGLIVPLYVVVLSVMGAAVGMSRRLPEIQRQAAHSVQNSGKGISAIVARERVVFQIMQIVAAPLIAVTAFAAFEPDTVTAAVLIGFTSGFASEAVLMKLRQASEALTRGRSEKP